MLNNEGIAPAANGAPTPVTRDLAYLRVAIVNVLFHGEPDAGDGGWVLIDAGLKGSAQRIAGAAAARFGPESRPSAIVLTHGHFDHVGALRELAERWDVPVFAHELEMPYLTGRSSYPPPDPVVGGGAMAFMSRLYPRRPIDLGSRVRALPADGAVPGMPGWRWLHTPGHTAGHVSLFRDADRTLVAGDAITTVKQESALAVMSQRQELHGPPSYYTQDWDESRESVARIAALEPEIIATGHGRPMRGPAMREALGTLARDFDQLERPARGRYVRQPALADRTGTVFVPPPVADPLPKVLVGVGVGLAAAAMIGVMRRRAASEPAGDASRESRTPAFPARLE